MKRFLLLPFFLLVFSFLLPATSLAAVPILPGNPGDQCAVYSNYEFCTPTAPRNLPPGNPWPVDESMAYVTLTFTNLPKLKDSNSRYFCLKSKIKDCGENDWKLLPPGELKVCGDGAQALKTSCDQNDWFHSGHTYWVFVAQGPNTKLSIGDVDLSAPFYVKHYYPTIVYPGMGGINEPTANTSIPLKLSGRDPKGGPGDSDLYNDYFIQVRSLDTEYVDQGSCLYVNDTSGTGERNIKFSPVSPDGIALTAGEYVLRIKDGTGGNGKSGDSAVCHEGDFTYYDIPFTLDSKGLITKIDKAYADPYGKEKSASTPPLLPSPPCPTGAQNKDGYCTVVQTALGPINTEPKAFVADVFRIVLSVAGVVAILFFIQAGYTLMNSSGNKEKVGQAREQITAAIIGLIFIILSIAIFEFIGIDILHIPGLIR